MELTLKHYGEIIVSYSRIVIAKGLTDFFREKWIGVLGSTNKRKKYQRNDQDDLQNGMDARIVNTMHDEIIVEARGEIAEKVADIFWKNLWSKLSRNCRPGWLLRWIWGFRRLGDEA
jgi:hypothetical protein